MVEKLNRSVVSGEYTKFPLDKPANDPHVTTVMEQDTSQQNIIVYADGNVELRMYTQMFRNHLR